MAINETNGAFYRNVGTWSTTCSNQVKIDPLISVATFVWNVVICLLIHHSGKTQINPDFCPSCLNDYSHNLLRPNLKDEKHVVFPRIDQPSRIRCSQLILSRRQTMTSLLPSLSLRSLWPTTNDTSRVRSPFSLPVGRGRVKNRWHSVRWWNIGRMLCCVCLMPSPENKTSLEAVILGLAKRIAVTSSSIHRHKPTFYFYFRQSDLHIIIRGFTPAIKNTKWYLQPRCTCSIFYMFCC